MSDGGFPLREALKRYSEPEVWAQLEELREQGEALEVLRAHHHGSMSGISEETFPYLGVEKRLVDSFLRELRDGLLIATGYDDRLPIRQKPAKIPAQLWRSLTPDFRDSTASGSGFTFAGILVQESPKRRAVKAEEHCRTWLESIAKNATERPQKSCLREEALSRFPGLKDRAFDRAWSSAVPNSWKAKGRPAGKPRNGDQSPE